MIRVSCLVLLSAAATAQTTFRISRNTFLPPMVGSVAFAIGDLDGDGDLDLVSGNGNSPNQLLQNDGRARFLDITAGRLVTPAGWNATRAIDLADIDGDGDLDVLVANADYVTNRVYRNDGNARFTEVTTTALPPNGEFTLDQIVGDFDGDGDVDWFQVDHPSPSLYRNDGTGRFTDVSATHLQNLPNGLGRANTHGFAADFDGDGDLDLFVPGSGLPVLLVNQGGGVFAPAPTALPIPSYLYGRDHAADLDGDGDLDLLVDEARYVLQNQGNGTFVDVTSTALAAASAPVVTPVLLDADGDGDADLLTTTDLWANDGAGVFVPQPLGQTIPSLGLIDTLPGDFDGDGDLDTLRVANFTTQVAALSPPRLGTFYTVDFHTPPGPASTLVIALASLAGASTPAGPLGTLRLDQGPMVTLDIQMVSNGMLQLTYPINLDQGFVGVQLHYQALLLEPNGTLRFTNAIREIVQ